MVWKGASRALVTTVLVLAIFAEQHGFAVIKEVEDRIEMDWSTLRIRYYGQAPGTALAGESYQMAVDRALQEGLSYLVKTFPEVQAGRQGRNSDDADREIAHRIASTTYIAHTVYFANGGVRVDLESSLARALASTDITFQKDKAEQLPSENTALLIRLDQAIKPKPHYEIVAESSGKVLFQVADIAKEEYEKNLMGRWFVGERGREFRSYAGDKPLVIEARVKGDGRLEVKPELWEEVRQNNPGLLETAKIALILPVK